MNEQLLQYIRDLSIKDHKTLSQKALKTVEEVGELAKVVLPYDNAAGTLHRFVDRQRILEETVDVILCALSVAYDLNFDINEIEQMMCTKSDKWGKIQYTESTVTYPLPFEIHVTVEIRKQEELEHFNKLCSSINVKPIVLELQNKNGSIVQDVMTSSKFYGNNRSAYEESERIASYIKQRGMTVKRVKIETVPWHPAAPQMPAIDIMPTDCYFESHIPLIFPKQYDISKILTDDRGMLVGVDYELHISKNVFKRTIDGRPIVMATMRDYDISYTEFEDKVTRAIDDLSTCIVQGIEIGKHIIEFSVYDTNISHDGEWLKTTNGHK